MSTTFARTGKEGQSPGRRSSESPGATREDVIVQSDHRLHLECRNLLKLLESFEGNRAHAVASIPVRKTDRIPGRR